MACRFTEDGGGVDERFFAIVTDLVDAPSELVGDDGRVAWSADTDLWGVRLRGRADDDEPLCPLGRPGTYHDDESGLEYNYFRYYDPATGRYLSADPLGLGAGPNPHAYVPNPLAWIDPFGLAKKQPSGMGGWYGKLQPANWTNGTDNTVYEINHVPAKDCYLNLGLPTDLKESTGPAMRMEYDDHRNFISTGSGKASQLWRAKQRSLILQGKFDESMKMDIELDPPNGITGFPMGMSAAAVKSAAERLGRIQVQDEDAPDEFHPMKVLAVHPQFEIVFELQDGKELTAAEVWIPRPGPEEITVRFRGIDVFRTPALELVERLAAMGLTVRHDEPDYWTVPRLSLGFTRVAGHEVPLDTDGEPLYFQAILTGLTDYYDFLLPNS